jgi:hypothetical protein
MQQAWDDVFGLAPCGPTAGQFLTASIPPFSLAPRQHFCKALIILETLFPASVSKKLPWLALGNVQTVVSMLRANPKDAGHMSV